MTQASVATALATAELSFAQERMWFLEQLHPDAAANNCSTTLELEGTLNLPHLQQCVNEIAWRHEALRTRFAFADGRPVQIVEAATRTTTSSGHPNRSSEPGICRPERNPCELPRVSAPFGLRHR